MPVAPTIRTPRRARFDPSGPRKRALRGVRWEVAGRYRGAVNNATASNRLPGSIRTRSPTKVTDPVPPSWAAYPYQRAGANRVFAVVRHHRGHRWNEAIGRGGDDSR